MRIQFLTTHYWEFRKHIGNIPFFLHVSQPRRTQKVLGQKASGSSSTEKYETPKQSLRLWQYYICWVKLVVLNKNWFMFSKMGQDIMPE